MAPYYEETKTKQKIKVLPCVKCGSEDIELNDCGYSSFNVAWGKCLDCENEVKIKPCDWNISKGEIAEKWNLENDPHILRARYLEEIHELRKKLDELPK